MLLLGALDLSLTCCRHCAVVGIRRWEFRLAITHGRCRETRFHYNLLHELLFFARLVHHHIVEGLAEAKQITALRKLQFRLLAQVSVFIILTRFEKLVVFTDGKPGSKVNDFEVSPGAVQYRLGQIEPAMRQVSRVRVRESMRDVNDEEVNHLDELSWNRILQHTKLCLLEPIIDIVITITEFCQLQEIIIVAVDFVGGHDVRRFGHQVDPRVDDGVDLTWRWCLSSAEHDDRVLVQLLEDELVVHGRVTLHRCCLGLDYEGVG